MGPAGAVRRLVPGGGGGGAGTTVRQVVQQVLLRDAAPAAAAGDGLQPSAWRPLPVRRWCARAGCRTLPEARSAARGHRKGPGPPWATWPLRPAQGLAAGLHFRCLCWGRRVGAPSEPPSHRTGLSPGPPGPHRFRPPIADQDAILGAGTSLSTLSVHDLHDRLVWVSTRSPLFFNHLTIVASATLAHLRQHISGLRHARSKDERAR